MGLLRGICTKTSLSRSVYDIARNSPYTWSDIFANGLIVVAYFSIHNDMALSDLAFSDPDRHGRNRRFRARYFREAQMTDSGSDYQRRASANVAARFLHLLCKLKRNRNSDNFWTVPGECKASAIDRKS